jgi:predicted dehydrogenase
MKATRIGILGGGWPGVTHAQAIGRVPGLVVTAIADLVPARQAGLQKLCPQAKLHVTAEALVGDPTVDVVVVCTPTDTHEHLACMALKKGKAVVIEPPVAPSSAGARKIAKFAERYNRPALVAFQRRFGGAEQAAWAAIDKGLIGKPYAVRASWTRSRAVPVGTGWYGKLEKSGGGALLDLGLPLLDLAGWYLGGAGGGLAVKTAAAVTHRQFGQVVPEKLGFDAEDGASALVVLEGGESVELSVAWAINQPPAANAIAVRVHGTEGCIDVYTPEGAVIYRHFNERGDAHRSVLKPPNVSGYDRLWRHVKDLVAGKEQPVCGLGVSAELMKVMERLYKSAPFNSAPFNSAAAAIQSAST